MMIEIDRMIIGSMSLDKMTVDEMSLDEMTCCHYLASRTQR
jgi:hypothetical protein